MNVKLVYVGILLGLVLILVGCTPTATGEAKRPGYADTSPVKLNKLWAAEVLTNNDQVGVNCNTICENAEKTCVGAYMGIEHDVAEVGDPGPEIITEWVPVSCTYESELNPKRCRCY